MALSKITNLSITDDTILNADVNSSAAIALSKLATDPSNATNLASGTVPTARLGSGTASSSTVLYGDQTYKTEPGGLTEVDQWRLTTAFQDTAQPIASNWERNDTEFEKIGTGMTEASGVFTFPSTGKWFIKFYSSLYVDNAASRSSGADLELSVNAGVAWSTIVAKGSSMYDSGTNTSANVYGEAVVDVTNTTNYLIRMSAIVATSITWTTGSSTRQNTGMTFLKLGDT
jgi:hypothetical protein